VAKKRVVSSDNESVDEVTLSPRTSTTTEQRDTIASAGVTNQLFSQIGVSESVTHKESSRPRSVFVMMPSGVHEEYKEGAEESDFIYRHIIKNAVHMAGAKLKQEFRITRETDNRISGSITSSIVRNTISSDISIVDITGMNPNVFFELGMRYALRRSITILLRNQESRIPFDVNVYRSISYKTLQFEQAAQELAEAIVHASAIETAQSDSLVYDVFPHLEVKIPGVYDSGDTPERGTSGLMPWKEFHDRINSVVEALRDVVTNGLYVPDVVLGISNGGLIVADLMGRSLFHKPLLSLWADRPAGLQMFNNRYNSSTLRTINEETSTALREHKGIEILLIDDIVSTSQTISLAKEFLERNLPENTTIRFLPMFNRNQKNRDVIRGLLLYDDPRIPVTEEQASRLMSTTRLILPYNKHIRE
jgi:hypoxanthine phosphoribosyltransferase